MNTKTKKLLLSTVALAAFTSTQASADDWSPRSVDQIKSELLNQDNSATYTIKYGDTLSTISEAMGIDMDVLAKLNQIADINLIFPDTVLKVTYDKNQQATSLQIETSEPASQETQTVASADLTTNEVTVNDQTVNLDQIQVPEASDEVAVSEATSEVASETAQTSEVATEETTVAPASSETSESSSADIASMTAAILEQKATSTAATQSEQASSEASSEATSEVASETAQTSEVATEEITVAPASSETSESSSADIASMTAAILEQKAASTVATQSEQASSETATSEATSEVASETAQTSEVASQTVVATTPNDGLSAHAIEVKNQLTNQFGITNIGGYRAGDQDHGTGTALDVMVTSSAQGAAVAQYVIDNYSSLGVSYIIWEQQFYSNLNSIYGAANTWGAMPDRGSATANHYDHVHISLTY